MTRRLALAGLAAVVTLMHFWMAAGLLPDRLGDGAADARPRPIEVAFVRDLAPAQPLPVAPRPARQRRPAVAAPPAAAASAVADETLPSAEAGASAALVVAEASPATEPPVAAPVGPASAALAMAEAGEQAASAPQSPASAPAPGAFEWPPSTRLSYRLSGHYRGPVEGQARVEWLRSGTRYQVHLEISVGPTFAPLVSRRVSSDGEITAQGLRPRRYDEETRVPFRAPRRQAILLDGDVVRLPSGRELPRPDDLQDSASQFVQLTWLFTTQPQRLQVGQTVAFSLVLPRQMEVWIYDVLETELLDTPAGRVEAVHVKPRREARPGGDLTAEVWFAPTLQCLPVRLLIRQDAETYVDLALERMPQQAEPGR